MKNDLAVEAVNLTKIYKLYEKPINRFRESISLTGKSYHSDFYALKDINFEINKGDSFGIIGKNGSGKSTLLKIITGVLTPSSGKINVNGRVAALLELGAGFNPELSGLENIYFNGTLSGATRSEMDDKLEEIISFADIGTFINQPVKVYSSGMFARLAFAVAVNINPDILIVDEALSVGDIRFQQKCLRKMKSFQESGKTILFVSHDTSVVENLCNKALWLETGIINAIGSSTEVCKKYFSHMATDENIPGNKVIKTTENINSDTNKWFNFKNCETFGDGGAEITSACIKNIPCNGNNCLALGGELITLSLKIVTSEIIENPIIGWILKDRLGNQIIGANSFTYGAKLPKFYAENTYIIKMQFELPYLLTGDYSLDFAIADGTQLTHVQKHWIHDGVIIKFKNPDQRQNMGMILSIQEIEFICENKSN